MHKHILEQYTDVQQEEKDLQRRIQSVTDQLMSMEMKGYMVADSVTCGRKGKKPLATRRIQGFPLPEYERKNESLKTYKLQLELADGRLLQLLSEVEKYIQGIDDGRMRRIMRYRYVDNCSWVQVAHRMGGQHTDESCRKACERYLLEEN